MKKKLSFITIILVILFSFGYNSVSVFIVDNNFMESTYKKGDKLFSNKWSMGVFLPFTNIKLFGDINISNQDIITFYYPRIYDKPIKEKKKMVSRCIGIPGDTIQIIDKKIYRDNQLVTEPESIQYKYRLVSKSGILTKDFFLSYNINKYNLIHDQGIYDILTTREIAENIVNDDLVSNIRLLNSKRDRNSPLIFPASPYYGFTEDNFGPVLVPFKGWSININYRNIGLYSKIIEFYEGKSVIVKDDLVYINSERVEDYTFIKNYYFVLDDNRDFADDSRYWGFLPEDHVIGVVF